MAGQVIPWNFPLLMAAWKIAPALATGNTVVLKPAETTPLTAITLAEIIAECDLPPGVVNVLPGGPAIGQALVDHPGIDKIAFTGSTGVGKAIQKSVAASGKRLSLELGGKAANIIFDDAPLDQAIEGIVNGIFFNQGHVCCAGSRLLVQESVHDEVIAALQDRLQTLRLGDPLDKNTDIGAINSAAQLARVQALADSGDDEGATRWSPACTLPAKGFWFPPTIFTGVSQANRIAREEIFGPVLSVLTFRTPQEAVDKANNTPYGLSAGIWTEKGSRILWMANRLRAGVVWANTFNRFDPSSPFGGYKESGFGREGGRHGLEAYLAELIGPDRARKRNQGHRQASETGCSGERPQDLQALHRRGVPALGVGPVLPGQRPVRPAAGPCRAGQPQGSAGRGQRRPQGIRRLAGGDRLQPRPGALPDRGDDRGPACPVRR